MGHRTRLRRVMVAGNGRDGRIRVTAAMLRSDRVFFEGELEEHVFKAIMAAATEEIAKGAHHVDFWVPSPSPAPRTAVPGTLSRVISVLLPGGASEQWLDEARDHLACIVEDGGGLRRARRSLLWALVRWLPSAWLRELHRRVYRRV
jgi:hypothetical protein